MPAILLSKSQHSLMGDMGWIFKVNDKIYVCDGDDAEDARYNLEINRDDADDAEYIGSCLMPLAVATASAELVTEESVQDSEAELLFSCSQVVTPCMLCDIFATRMSLTDKPFYEWTFNGERLKCEYTCEQCLELDKVTKKFFSVYNEAKNSWHGSAMTKNMSRNLEELDVLSIRVQYDSGQSKNKTDALVNTAAYSGTVSCDKWYATREISDDRKTPYIFFPGMFQADGSTTGVVCALRDDLSVEDIDGNIIQPEPFNENMMAYNDCLGWAITEKEAKEFSTLDKSPLPKSSGQLTFTMWQCKSKELAEQH